MSTKNPPAFPRPHSRDANSGDRPRDVPEQDGMTLRDYFAARALAGMMARGVLAGESLEVAPCAYAYADAMLRERAK
jgi:hypothetical protein